MVISGRLFSSLSGLNSGAGREWHSAWGAVGDLDFYRVVMLKVFGAMG